MLFADALSGNAGTASPPGVSGPVLAGGHAGEDPAVLNAPECGALHIGLCSGAPVWHDRYLPMGEEWKTESLRLKDRHGWKAKPGFAICAIDRGAIRFDYPEGWHVSADSGQVNVRDHPEPNDNCVLAVSQMHLPRGLADQVPVRELVLGSIRGDDRDVLERKEVIGVPREDGIDLAYTEIRHMDPEEQRQASSRIAVARGGGVYCLITFDLWVEDLPKYEPVWEEALRSLTLGIYIKDPTAGPIGH